MISHQRFVRQQNYRGLSLGIVVVLIVFLFTFSGLAYAAGEAAGVQGRSWKDYLSIVPAILLLLFAFKKMFPGGGSRKGSNSNWRDNNSDGGGSGSSGGGIDGDGDGGGGD